MTDTPKYTNTWAGERKDARDEHYTAADKAITRKRSTGEVAGIAKLAISARNLLDYYDKTAVANKGLTDAEVESQLLCESTFEGACARLHQIAAEQEAAAKAKAAAKSNNDAE